MDVLCIGHASWDISVLVDEFPREDAKYETRSLHECGGGPAANAAYLLGKWGLKTEFAGVVGDDRHGWQIGQELVEAGVETARLEMRRGHVTPVSIIVVNRRNGSRTIINRKAATAALDFAETRATGGVATGLARTVAGASAPEMGPHVLLFDGHELAASLSALAAYPDAVSILDAGSVREGTVELAGRVDYLAASARLARQATGVAELDSEEAQRECVARLRAKFNSWTIVTIGARGLVVDVGEGFRARAAYPAEAVDTTGAGDIFHGALAYGVATKRSLEETLRMASMAGSLSVRRLGGRTSFPPLPVVEEALRVRG
jgi:sugar/nucleoside kinase (ribokinase family)